MNQHIAVAAKNFWDEKISKSQLGKAFTDTIGAENIAFEVDERDTLVMVIDWKNFNNIADMAAYARTPLAIAAFGLFMQKKLSAPCPKTFCEQALLPHVAKDLEAKGLIRKNDKGEVPLRFRHISLEVALALTGHQPDGKGDVTRSPEDSPAARFAREQGGHHRGS